MTDTIFALATAPGKSGIAVIRVSGPDAHGCLEAFGIAAVPPARLATLVTLRYGGETIDTALLLTFAAPQSFTGEDVVEFHLHGSRAVIRRVLETLHTLPALRLAEPGEFTSRAFFHGKMDLTAAEGLADLIDAETEAQRKQALRLMRGDIAKFYDGLRDSIVHALAYLEAYIDFPDEDIPDHVLAEIQTELAPACARIEAELARGAAGEKIRDGIFITIIGPPNAGKSSLLNLLARRDVAIVSAIAGTTRDVLEVQIDIGGYAVVLADTAGIREQGDAIEREGIRRAHVRAAEADITVLVLDATMVAGGVELKAFAPLVNANTLIVLNKTDVTLPSPVPELWGKTPLLLSVHQGVGVTELLTAIRSQMDAVLPSEAQMVTHARHRAHLVQALRHLVAFASAGALGLELQCEELRRAATEIGKITGQITVDELLGHIFSRFCIGK
jgi:tRNA modification GTPase